MSGKADEFVGLGRAIGLAAAVLACAGVQGQEAGERPIPRLANGWISFSGTPESVGNFDGPAIGTLASGANPGPLNLPANLRIEEVPFLPWARDLFEERRAGMGKDDPHTRCKPSGGPRIWHTPYGMEIVMLPELDEILLIMVGAPHSWRTIHMDGRGHPADLQPSRYGHAIGHWEGDTLVVDTVGFTTNFWMSRSGFPHTEQLHLVERISRPSFGRLRYEAVIDDPGAYTQTWSGGWYLNWVEGSEPFDYLCQENNLDPARMIGEQE